MFHEGDAVELTEAIPIYHLERGNVGVVMGVHRDNRTYRVAFTRADGRVETIDLPYGQLRHRTGDGA